MDLLDRFAVLRLIQVVALFVLSGKFNFSTYHLKGLSETRWNCKAVSLQRLMEKGVLEAVLATLEHVADTTSDGSARGKAVGLIASIKQFAFIVCLCSLCPVLTVLNQASECMQQVNIDFLQAQQVLSALKTEYRAMRTEENWNKSLTVAKNLAETLDIQSELPLQRKRKVPRRLDGDSQSIESVYSDSTEDMKICFTTPWIDSSQNWIVVFLQNYPTLHFCFRRTWVR